MISILSKYFLIPSIIQINSLFPPLVTFLIENFLKMQMNSFQDFLQILMNKNFLLFNLSIYAILRVACWFQLIILWSNHRLCNKYLYSLRKQILNTVSTYCFWLIISFKTVDYWWETCHYWPRTAVIWWTGLNYINI